ncbi:MAG: hypothetical protein NZ958_04795 [Bacteroidia bacterium]|nr:hypothetical protein [Bacteroidia bacterium]MDW8088924.1 hypothetical protein [Bacteroidia bacterium]
MMRLLLAWLQLMVEWGERVTSSWTLYGAEWRKSGALGAPRAYTLLLNGADSHGLPYQTEDPRQQGWADSVISPCLRLDTIDSFFVSFAYQRGGRMDPPEPTDTLVLWGWTREGTWLPLWQAPGRLTPDSTFEEVHLTLREPHWRHACFRLKWSVWGSTYGAYDNWHIAYTYVRTDTATKSTVWQAIPALYGAPYGTWGEGYLPRNPLSLTLRGPAGRLINLSAAINQQVIYSRSFRLPAEVFTLTVPPLPLAAPGQYEIAWTLHDTEVNRTITLYDSLILEGVWGYDDGEMESGYGLRQNGQAFCQRFQLDSVQRITRIGLRFFPIPSQYGKPFQLCIWQIDQSPQRPLHCQLARYRLDSLGGWSWYEIDSVVLVQGAIGVGCIQLDAQPLGLGWDARSERVNAVWIESGGGWQPSSLNGVLFLRVALQSPTTGLLKASAEPFLPNVAEPGAPLLPQGLWQPPLCFWSLAGQLVGCYTASEPIHAPSVPGLYLWQEGGGRTGRLIVGTYP